MVLYNYSGHVTGKGRHAPICVSSPPQRKNPNWKPDEDGAMFMSQLRESAEATDLKTSGQFPTESLTYISLPQPHPVSHIYTKTATHFAYKYFLYNYIHTCDYT